MKMKKKNILLLLIGLTFLILTISCSSTFSATISGTVKAEPRDNSSADEQSSLSDASVYVFFDEREFEEYEDKWENYSSTNTKSLSSTIAMPTVSDTIRTTTTNTSGGFSITTMWVTNSPLFGKDGDEKTFHIAVYHKDYGMFFDDSQYSVFSDSSQNISFLCEYDEKLAKEYSIELNLYDYSDNNSSLTITEVNPKVVIKYTLLTEDGDQSDIGEITQTYEELPTTDSGVDSNNYSFICDKYYYDSSTNTYTDDLVYPSGTIYFYDKGEEGEKVFRMCDDEGNDLSESGTSFSITDNSDNLSKDIYVDRLSRDYRIEFNFDYPQNDDTNSSNSTPTLEELSPKTTIKVYFDGYDETSNSIEVEDSDISEDEIYKTITYSVDEVPSDGYYSFNVSRLFNSDGDEIYPSISYQLEDDSNDVEYVQTDIDGTLIDDTNEIEKTLVNYSEDNYSTSADTYLDKVKLDYTIEFNLEDYEDGDTVAIATSDSSDDTTYYAKVKLYIVAYDGDSTSLDSLDFTSADEKYPDTRVDTNTYTFEWEKYDSDGNVQYPALKYFIYDTTTPNYCHITTSDNINYTHIKSKEDAISNVDTIAFRNGVTSKSVDVDMEKLNEDYTINFTLNDIEDNNSTISFEDFDPKVKLNIYEEDTTDANLVLSKYYKDTNATGIYTFNWEKYGDDLDLADLPDSVNSDTNYPIVKYYLFNTDSDSYEMLYDNDSDNQIEVTSLANSPSTSYEENETSKDVDVYIRSKKIIYDITFNLINIATNDELTISNVDPTITLSYNDGDEDVVETYTSIPTNNTYSIEVERNDSVSTTVTIDLQDTRNEVRYRLCSNDPDNEVETERYTVGSSDDDRYEESFTLTNTNDNELNLYIKDYQYPTDLSLEGRFILNDSTLDNGHTVWLLPEFNGTYDEEDVIELSSPTQSNYINDASDFNSSNIENGYFSTSYEQSIIADFDQYSSSSKYLTQNFKVIVNNVQNESSPELDDTDYMSIFTTKNNSSDEVEAYVYVDGDTTYVL
ncbi:MAG: hypothetical protein ACPKM0_07150 [Pleomorphochaeta sp.]